jgi:hypothetical protein
VCKDNRLRVNWSGATDGYKVKLFASDGTTEIGKTVGSFSSGVAYIDLTNTTAAPVNTTNGLSVVVKLYQSNGTTLVDTSGALTVYAGDIVTYT